MHTVCFFGPVASLNSVIGIVIGGLEIQTENAEMRCFVTNLSQNVLSEVHMPVIVTF